jgi:N utilization substance protein B
MGKRNTGRTLAMQAIYQAEIQNVDIKIVIDNFLKPSKYMPETKKWAIFLAKNAWEKKDEADKYITDLAIDWNFDRINPIDKSLLRIAFWELQYSATPKNIVIDEALEIAKRYSTDDSPKFINGILGKFVEQKCSPA